MSVHQAPEPSARHPGASSGRPIDQRERLPLERAFNQDLSAVRLHADAEDATLAASMGARAFTRGDQIFFGSRGYQPSTPEGRHTLAHELAHVIQQRAPVDARGTHTDDESAAEQAGAAAAQATSFQAPAGLSDVRRTAAPAVQRQPEHAPTGTFELPLIPPEWLKRARRGDLLVGRLGDRMVALPAEGAFSLVQPPVPTTPAGQPPPVPVLTLPTVSKESIKLVSAGGSPGFLIDAGGKPAIVSPGAVNAMNQALGTQNFTAILITHLHEDHVQSLTTLVLTQGIRPENLHFPAAFVANPAAPSSLFARLLRDLGNNPRGQALGYGPGARLGAIPTPTQGDWWRTEIPHGDLTIEAWGLTPAFRELEARRMRGQEADSAQLGGLGRTSNLADTASLLVRVTHRPTGFRTLFVSDERFTDLELLRTAMTNRAYEEVFTGVRIVEGVGHHMGALESTAEANAFASFLKTVQLGSGGGRVTVMAQSQETRSGRQFLNRSAIAALNEAGIDVHVSLEPQGTGVGTLTADTSGAVRFSGVGRAESFLSTSPVRAEIDRLNALRTVENTLTRYEKYAEPQHRRSAEFRAAREQLERELKSYLDVTADNVQRTAAGRASGTLRDPGGQAAALARVRTTVAPVESLVTPGYMEGIADLGRVGHWSEIFEQEAAIARTTGRMSDRGIDALWNVDPESARSLLSRSGLSRQVRRSTAAQLPGAPASVPVRLVAVGLLALQVVEIGAPIAASIRASRFDSHVRPALEAIMWWQRAGVFPAMEAVDDNLWPWSNEWTTESARVQELLNDNEVSYLTLTSISDDNWGRFTIWASARLKNALDWALYISDSPAVRVVGGGYMGHQKFEYYTSEVHGDTIGFTLTETWRHSDRLDLILNAAATDVIAGSEKDIAQAAVKQGESLTPAFRSTEVHSTPLFDALPQANGRWRFRPGEERALYSVFAQRKTVGYDEDALLYSFPDSAVDDVPDGYLVVGGADYNTVVAVLHTRNDYKISNVDGYGGHLVGSLYPNTQQVLLAKKTDLVEVK